MIEIAELEEDLVFHITLVSLFTSREGDPKISPLEHTCIPIERQPHWRCRGCYLDHRYLDQDDVETGQ